MGENTIKSYRIAYIVKGKWKSVNEKLLSAEKKIFQLQSEEKNRDFQSNETNKYIYKEKENQTQRT